MAMKGNMADRSAIVFLLVFNVILYSSQICSGSSILRSISTSQGNGNSRELNIKADSVKQQDFKELVFPVERTVTAANPQRNYNQVPLLCKLLKSVELQFFKYSFRDSTGQCSLKLRLSRLFEPVSFPSYETSKKSPSFYEDDFYLKRLNVSRKSARSFIPLTTAMPKKYLLNLTDLMKATKSPYPLKSKRKNYSIQSTRNPYPFKSTRNPYHLKSTSHPYALKSTSHPFALKSTSHPYALKSTSHAFALKSTRNPYPSQSTKNPYPLKSTRNPYPSQSTRNPLPSQSTKNPYPSQSTRNPYPLKSTRNPYPSQSTRTPHTLQSKRTFFPVSSTRGPFKRSTTRDTTRQPYPWETTRQPYPWETTRKVYPWETTRQPYPWETTRKPYPWETTRKPYHWETTRQPYPWETTRKVYPWETTRQPYPWETTRQPYPWETTRKPYPWETTRKPYPWETTDDDWLDNWTFEPWRPLTFPPFPTFTPYEYRYSSNFDSRYFLIVAGVFVGATILGVCLRVCFLNCALNSRTEPENVFLHLPPPPTESQSTLVMFAAANESTIQGVINEGFSPIDKPPDYYTVTNADKAQGANNYAPVNLTSNQLLPPPYGVVSTN